MNAWVIARNTVGDALRKRVLLVFLLIAIVMLFLALFLAYFSAREQLVIFKSVAFVILLVFGALISITTSIFLIPNEVEKRTIYSVLSKPVQRWEFFFGKFLAEHVVAIEPQPALVPILARNLRVNDIPHASLMACAAGAHVGVGQLCPPEGAVKNVGHTRVTAPTGEALSTVPIIPLVARLYRSLEPYAYTLIRMVEDLAAVRVAVDESTRIALDLETTGLNPRQDRIRLLRPSFEMLGKGWRSASRRQQIE